MLHHVISWRMAGRHADVDEAELAALAPGASGRDAVARAAVAAPAGSTLEVPGRTRR